jgi:hypothetical protein
MDIRSREKELDVVYPDPSGSIRGDNSSCGIPSADGQEIVGIVKPNGVYALCAI